MWVSASAATEDLCFSVIQPILDDYRPPGVSALGFKKVSLGTVPPKVNMCWLTLLHFRKVACTVSFADLHVLQ